MGCLCSKSGKGKGPVVAVFGSTGMVGKLLMPVFLDALNQGTLRELRITTRDVGNPFIREWVSKGAKAFLVDFNDQASLTTALKGTDAVVSTLGVGPNTKMIHDQLLDAMVAAGTNVYFPSEFGCNHYKLPSDMENPVLTGKKDHFQKAKLKGVNPIRIICGFIYETTFGPWFGFDNTNEVWNLIGDGNSPSALTGGADVGRFTLEAIRMATSGWAVPDSVEFSSVQKSMREYAVIFDEVAGRKTQLEFTPLDEAKAEYMNTQDFYYALRIILNTFDYDNSKDNEFLNPGGQKWKVKMIEEYAKETKGRPNA